MTTKTVRVGLLIALVHLGMPAWSRGAEAGHVKITPEKDKLRVEVNGKWFTDYCYQNVPRPYLYPILGPGGVEMTRDWPMKDAPGESHDHPHHRSLWFGHGRVNSIDFWSELPGSGRIVHDRFLAEPASGTIQSLNRWVAPDGRVVCTDRRTLRFFGIGEARLLDFDVVIEAPTDSDVVFGDTKEGTMAIRLADSMRIKTAAGQGGQGGQGHLLESTGVRDADAWGKRADWVDAWGPVQGKIVGVAIFDHPDNPRHPTWWHARDYGLVAANPFGQHDFEKLPDKNAGNLKIPRGQSIAWRYRFYFHEGDAQQADVAQRYQDYIAGKPTNP